jgi:O-antigen ligase/polysaccharide polymerase Wzy-like membrane protein
VIERDALPALRPSRSPARPTSTHAHNLSALALLLVCALTGWLSVRYGGKAIAVSLAAVGTAALVRARAFGVLLGLALLVDLNGLPGVNVNPGGMNIARLQDASGVLLLASLAYVVASGKVTRRTPLQRSLYLAAGALAGWWLITWAKTGAFDSVPPTLAAKFARDFLYFALTLPLLCDVFVTYPRLRRQMLWTAGAGALIYAVAQIAQSGGHLSLNFILHPELSAVVQGTTRVYSPMNSLVRAGFALSCGALILAPTPSLRRRGIVGALVFGTAMLLQLTRAAYFGAAVGFALAGAIWWFRRGPIRGIARKRLIVVPLLAAIVLALGATVSSTERHVFSTVGTRALTGLSDVNSNSGTVGYRVSVSRQMLHLLGQDWPIGLGFIHPAAHPYPNLPGGSIRNSDLGLLNVLMTMGAVGAILLYLPVLLVLRALTRAASLPEAVRDEWLRLGATIWAIGTIDLFSFGGLEVTACMLAIATSVVASRASPEPAGTSTPAGSAEPRFKVGLEGAAP